MNIIKRFFVQQMFKRSRLKSRKKQPWKGRQFFIPVKDKKPIEVFLYEPKNKKSEFIPVMFNIHGGAWVGCDATYIDDQSQEMANLLSCYVVNINYTKLDIKPFPYPQLEVVDTVMYFAENATEFGIDIKRFNLIGYSAGGHICSGAAVILKNLNFKLCSNIPIYPFLDFHYLNQIFKLDEKTNQLMDELFFKDGVDKFSAILSPGSASVDELKGLSATEIILCGPDELYQQGIDYFELLRKANVDVTLKVFDKAIHGFMELDFSKELKNDEIIQKDQYELCFAYLKKRMYTHWGYSDES